VDVNCLSKPVEGGEEDGEDDSDRMAQNARYTGGNLLQSLKVEI